MAIPNIDFEGVDNKGVTQTDEQSPATANNQEEVTNFSGNDVDDISNNTDIETVNTNDINTEEQVVDDDSSSTGELVPGDQLSFDGKTYVIDTNGDIIDEDGNVFKEAKDVNDWLNSIDVEDEDDLAFDINELKEEIGVDVKDEDGNSIEFENSTEGVKSFIKGVIDTKSKEIQEATLNRFYATNPLVKQFVDYVQLTGTARGFGEIPDRSGIVIDETNEAQQIAVIKMAANEFGNKTINDNYINWLRDNGNLYSYAKDQLNALIDKDKAYRKEIETKAAEQRKQESEEIANYWNNVNKIINSRVIGGYKIPENFTREVNGKKIICNSDDFFNYISNASITTENGNNVTGYQRDLANLTNEEYLNRELIDAWLMYTGGSYKDLVDMAIKENEVRKLIVKSKNLRTNKTVKVVKKQEGKVSINDILL